MCKINLLLKYMIITCFSFNPFKEKVLSCYRKSKILKLFHSKDGKLDSIEQAKPFDYEKIIQTLVEKNLSSIFPELEFVISEHEIDDLRPDSIAFNTESKSFAIIEYKKVKHGGALDQGLAYLNLLEEKLATFVLLYNEIKGVLYDVKDINLAETRIIIIAPEYNTHQLRAARSIHAPIELYEIKQYENSIISFNKIENKTSGIKKHIKVKQQISYEELSEEDYISGKYHSQNPNHEIRELYKKLKKIILNNFEKLEYRQRMIYGGYYSREDSSTICTTEILKSKIYLCYSTTKKNLIEPSNFVRDKTGKGHHGVGDYMSYIENEKDVEKAISLIRKVYEDKISV